jgi:protein TonB
MIHMALWISLLFSVTMSLAQESGESRKDSTAESPWDEAPQVLKSAPVDYPKTALADSAQGTCWLEVDLDDNGHVVNARVSQSSGRTDLDTAAIKSIQQWLYQPATKNGRSIPSRIPQCFTFRLKK